MASQCFESLTRYEALTAVLGVHVLATHITYHMIAIIYEYLIMLS